MSARFSCVRAMVAIAISLVSVTTGALAPRPADASTKRATTTSLSPSDIRTPDFTLSYKAHKAKGRQYKVVISFRNPRPWMATSIRACVSLPDKRSTITNMDQRGSLKNRGTGCWILRRLASKRAATRTVTVKTRKRLTKRNPLALRAAIRAGNANGVHRTFAVQTIKRLTHPRKKRHAAPSAQPNRTLRANVCTAPTRLGVVFVIDDSGSMSGNDPDRLRSQSVAVGLDQVPDGSLAGATRFSDGSSELFPVGTVDASTRPDMKSAADTIFSSGSTDFEAAFLGAQRQLGSMSTADKTAVIFLSDGRPNTELFTSDQPIGQAGTPIYTISLGSANRTIMADIAARSGGQTFDAQSAGDLQSIFARIVASLTCDAQTTTESFSLSPGTTRSIPFDVAANDGEFRALASWSGGGVTVTATRPDASQMAPGSLRTDEAFVDESTYALLSGRNPAAGRWQLNITADASNTSDVQVSIDVFKRQLTTQFPLPDPVESQPSPPLPKPSPKPSSKPAPAPFDVKKYGRRRDPCAALPTSSTTKRVLGGRETRYDRTSSVSMVCSGFGAPQDFNFRLTPAMSCALVAAAAEFAGKQFVTVARKAIKLDDICEVPEIIEAFESGNWLGYGKSKACSYFSEIFAGGFGILAAGVATPTGPGAVVVGVRAYRGMAATLNGAICSGLLSGIGTSFGEKLEADHERNIAVDVVRRGKCIANKSAFSINSWRAVDC